MKNKYGYEVGDKFVVTSNTSFTASFGDILTLQDDDGSDCPFFTGSTALPMMERVACRYTHLKKLDVPQCVAEPLPKVSGYKFKVDSPKQSRRLQKILFKLGYSWEYNSKEVLTFAHSEVYANICDKRLTKSASRAYFDKHKYQLTDIDWLTKLV